MTTEGEKNDNETRTRSARKRRGNLALSSILKNFDEENSSSESTQEESSEDEWKSSRRNKKNTRQTKVKRTLNKMLAERTRMLRSNFDKTKLSVDETKKSLEVPPVWNAHSKVPKPDTTTAVKILSCDTEGTKSVVSMCDVSEKVTTIEKKGNEDSEGEVFSSSSSPQPDNILKCDSSIKVEQVDEGIEIKEEAVNHVRDKFLKIVKPDRDPDADTVILLSDDDDDVNNEVPKTVILECNILKTHASPILTGNEIPSSPATPKIRVKPMDQISSISSQNLNNTNVAAIVPNTALIPEHPSIPGIPFSSSGRITVSSPISPGVATNFPPAISSSRPRYSRGGSRGPRQSSRGRGTYRTRGSSDLRGITPRRTSEEISSSKYSSQSRVTTPPRLDSISLKNISPTGTIIRTGSDSVTITPRKKSPERPPVQRQLFKNEVEGIIAARDTGFVVRLANGTFLPLNNAQVIKLRAENNGTLPTRLRIPVPSDVAATIEPRILIED